MKNIPPQREKARVSDPYRNLLLISLCITPMTTNSIQMTFLFQETSEAQWEERETTKQRE